ncbi:MAG TPA: plastocyanin/azurin family copper-binding protein [Candidatus Bathyarchaeia archaeon]|nr:plastocyanin/azurin family copper-binding protein [Candidatus Bathyarchaeia archaeon]
METAPAKKKDYLKILVVPVLIVLAIGAGIGLAGLGIYQAVTGSNVLALPSGTTSTGQVVAVSMPNGVGTNQALNFVPVNVTLAKGGTVKWTNNDPTPHTVTSTSVPSGAQSFDSKNMVQGSTFTYTFTVSGTYLYICAYHSWMFGSVTVTG